LALTIVTSRQFRNKVGDEDAAPITTRAVDTGSKSARAGIQ
jgi:hypothetical protein